MRTIICQKALAAALFALALPAAAAAADNDQPQIPTAELSLSLTMGGISGYEVTLPSVLGVCTTTRVEKRIQYTGASSTVLHQGQAITTLQPDLAKEGIDVEFCPETGGRGYRVTLAVARLDEMRTLSKGMQGATTTHFDHSGHYKMGDTLELPGTVIEDGRRQEWLLKLNSKVSSPSGSGHAKSQVEFNKDGVPVLMN